MATPLPGTGAPAPRELRRRQRIELDREQVLDIAEELFGAQGYQGTSLQQVAQRCGFSVGAVYLFVDSKEALLREILSRRGSHLLALVRDCAEADRPPLDTLVAVCDTIIAFHREHPGFGRLATRMHAPGGAEGFPFPAGDFASHRDEALRPVTLVIRRGQREGTVRAGEPLVLARLMSALVTAHHGMDPTLLGTTVVIDDDAFRGFVRDAFRAQP